MIAKAFETTSIVGKGFVEVQYRYEGNGSGGSSVGLQNNFRVFPQNYVGMAPVLDAIFVLEDGETKGSEKEDVVSRPYLRSC